MAASTAPLLAAGGIILFDDVILRGQAPDWKEPVAIGLLVGMFALAEPLAPEAVKLLSYLVVVSVLLGAPSGHSPVKDFQAWVGGGSTAVQGGAISTSSSTSKGTNIFANGGSPNATAQAPTQYTVGTNAQGGQVNVYPPGSWSVTG